MDPITSMMAAAPAVGGAAGLVGRLIKDVLDNRREIRKLELAEAAARDIRSAEHIAKLLADPEPQVIDFHRKRTVALGKFKWERTYEGKKVVKPSGLRAAFASVVGMLGMATAFAIAVFALDPSVTLTTIPAASGVDSQPVLSLAWGLIETHRDTTEPADITAGGASLALCTGVLTLVTFTVGLNARPGRPR